VAEVQRAREVAFYSVERVPITFLNPTLVALERPEIRYDTYIHPWVGRWYL
jgi:hypothetical protein